MCLDRSGSAPHYRAADLLRVLVIVWTIIGHLARGLFGKWCGLGPFDKLCVHT